MFNDTNMNIMKNLYLDRARANNFKIFHSKSVKLCEFWHMSFLINKNYTTI